MGHLGGSRATPRPTKTHGSLRPWKPWQKTGVLRGQVGSTTRASYHGPRLKGKWTFLFPASASIQPGTRRWSSRIVRLIGQGCLSSTRFVRNPGPVTVSMRSLFLWFCCRGWGDREIRLIAVILDRSSILRS